MMLFRSPHSLRPQPLLPQAPLPEGRSASLRSLALAGALLASTGCATQTVWLLKFDKTSPADCESGIEHNFSSAFVPTTADDWTDVSEVQRANDIAFAQLIEAGRGVGVLVIGDQAFPGERSGNDWTFTWTDAVGTADGQQHVSGYGYFEYTETTTEWDITLDTERGETTGELEQIDLRRLTWRESDTWADSAAATIGYGGQIPSESMLLVTNPETGTDEPATNRADTEDCTTTADARWCEISDVTVCETSRDFTATRTRLEDESAYDGLSDVSGSAGD